MSHEQIQKPEFHSDFATNYPFPKDQAVTQYRLAETFNTDFPDSARALEHNLETLNALEGVAFSRIETQDNPTPRREEFRYDAEGLLPLQTVAMIGGIYALTGAETIKEDMVSNGKALELIRRGSYNGSDVYFAERTHLDKDEVTGAMSKSAVTVSVIAEEAAQAMIKAPYSHQWEEFQQIAGKPIYNHEREGITQENYVQVAREIAMKKAAKQAKVDQDAAAINDLEKQFKPARHKRAAKFAANLLKKRRNRI
jgi:hypothetical protein